MSKVLTQTDLRLSMITRSARVRRYHCHDVLHPQNVGEHTYGVMWFVTMICGGVPSATLLLATLMHDMHEYITGDMPATTKRHPGVKEAFDILENSIEQSLAIPAPVLTENEAWILKMADSLEGLAFCAFELRQGNKEIITCFENYRNYCRAQLDAAPFNIVDNFASAAYDKYAAELYSHFKETHHHG